MTHPYNSREAELWRIHETWRVKYHAIALAIATFLEQDRFDCALSLGQDFSEARQHTAFARHAWAVERRLHDRYQEGEVTKS